MTQNEYLEKVASDWLDFYGKAESCYGEMYEQSYNAFMANAINMAMLNSAHKAEFMEAIERVSYQRTIEKHEIL